MNQVLHFFRKDLRLMRWPLLYLVICLLGTMYWYSLLPAEKRMTHIGALSLWRYFIWIMCFLIIGGLTLRDAPLREGAFFRTRPVALSTVLRSKFLIATLIVVMSAMIESVSLLMLGLKPGVLDFLLIFAEEILVLSALGAVSMALALRQEAAGKYISSVAIWGGSLLLGWIIWSWIKDWYLMYHPKPKWTYEVAYLELSRLLMAQVSALTGSVAGIVLFGRSGRRETISKALTLTAVCSIAAWMIWPVNFVKAFVPAPREAPKDEWPDLSKLSFAFGGPPPGRGPNTKLTFCSGVYNDGTYRTIRGWYRLHGIPDGWVNGQNAYNSVLSLTSGLHLSSSQSAWAPIPKEGILSRFGIKTGMTPVEERVSSADLADFRLKDAANAMHGANLKGTLQIPLRRPVLLAKLPFKTGQTVWVDGRLIEIAKVENSGNEIDYSIMIQTHMVKLRGGWQKIWTNRFAYVVVNTAKKEFLVRRGGGESNQQAGHYSLQSENASLAISPGHTRIPIPPDWVDGADLLIVGEEYGGSFLQSFDLPNIDLFNE